MADRGTEKRARYALADLVAGRYQDVAAFLAKLGDVPVPELDVHVSPDIRRATGLRSEHDQNGNFRVKPIFGPEQAVVQMVTPSEPKSGHRRYAKTSEEERQKLRQQRAQEPVTPLPKPTKRNVDRDSLAEFAAKQPGCSLLNCRGSGEIDTHHIRKRSAGGGDEEQNLLRLHRSEHDEWHRIGREAFAAKYASRLRPLDLLKLRYAAEAEVEAKLGGRASFDDDLRAIEDA